MPAAAVIPAPIAYIKVVAVKTLVVGPRRGGASWAQAHTCDALLFGEVVHWTNLPALL